MARNGRAGPALAIAAIGSFIGGNVATIGLVILALPLTSFALQFGPPEFSGLMVLGLSMVTALAGKSMSRALMSAAFGLMIAMVGTDPVQGAGRFTFGQTELRDGFGLLPVLIGIFGIGEILLTAETEMKTVFQKVGRITLSIDDIKASAWPIIRGTGIGFFLGLIPGVGSIVPTFMSYAIEKRLSKTPEKFGTGMIEGVAGPETANNAYVNAALIPLFTLGIPSSAAIAVLMGAFMMNGLIPGPFLFREHADFVWAVIASLYVGNLMLLVLNLPLIPLWVTVLKIPYSLLYALILGFCVLGTYASERSLFDVWVMTGFGVLGYWFKKLDVPLAPLVLTLILGPLLEDGLRRSLEISQGDFSIFFTRPISAALLIISGVIIATTTIRALPNIRAETEA